MAPTDNMRKLKDLGWIFRAEERSAGVYTVTGRDRAGRIVEATGTDPDLLTEQCRRDALRIAEQIAAKPGTKAC